MLLLRLFKKLHERYPWEKAGKQEAGTSYSLSDLEQWQAELSKVVPDHRYESLKVHCLKKVD